MLQNWQQGYVPLYMVTTNTSGFLVSGIGEYTGLSNTEKGHLYNIGVLSLFHHLLIIKDYVTSIINRYILDYSFPYCVCNFTYCIHLVGYLDYISIFIIVEIVH